MDVYMRYRCRATGGVARNSIPPNIVREPGDMYETDPGRKEITPFV